METCIKLQEKDKETRGGKPREDRETREENLHKIAGKRQRDERKNQGETEGRWRGFRRDSGGILNGYRDETDGRPKMTYKRRTYHVQTSHLPRTKLMGFLTKKRGFFV